MKTFALKAATLVPAALLFCAAGARAQFSLGDAADYAVLFEGDGNNSLQINSTPVGGSTISGNIGLGDENGGTPQLDLNNPAVINGNVNFAGTANVQNSSATLNGLVGSDTAGVSSSVSAVTTALTTVNNLSSQFAGDTGAQSVAIALAGTGGTQMITASGGTLISGTYVYNVSSMSFNNGNTLIISGSANQYVVLNFNFSTHFAGTIELTGGITSDQVLFNIIGGNNLTGGNTLQFAANGATQEGTFLDPNGTITMNSVHLDGRVFGGDDSNMQIQSGGTVAAPPSPAPVPEASTIISGALMLVPLGLGALRALRQNRAAVK